MYDDKQSVTVEGAITKFEWSNRTCISTKQLMATGQTLDWKWRQARLRFYAAWAGLKTFCT